MVSGMVDTDDTRTGRVAERDASDVASDTIFAPAGSVRRAAGRWMVPAPRWLRRAALTLIYAPAAAILLAGALAAARLLGDVWRLLRAISTHALTIVPDTYDRLALAARVALVSGAFLALLCALVVVAVGCRGRRWWRLYLIPGVPLTAVAALLFIVAVAWCAAGINQRLGWSSAMWEMLIALALADAVVVAARVGGIGAGPLGTRRARLRGRLGGWRPAGGARTLTARETRPIPVVRFGPRVTGVPASESALPAEASAPSAPEGVPTAEELRAAAEPDSVAHDERESAVTHHSQESAAVASAGAA